MSAKRGASCSRRGNPSSLCGRLKNLFSLYLPLADVWRIYDNTDLSDPQIVARGQAGQTPTILLPESWNRMKEVADNG